MSLTDIIIEHILFVRYAFDTVLSSRLVRSRVGPEYVVCHVHVSPVGQCPNHWINTPGIRTVHPVIFSVTACGIDKELS